MQMKPLLILTIYRIETKSAGLTHKTLQSQASAFLSPRAPTCSMLQLLVIP